MPGGRQGNCEGRGKKKKPRKLERPMEEAEPLEQKKEEENCKVSMADEEEEERAETKVEGGLL